MSLEFGMRFTLDEVQSSYGRTGRMWALEHEGLTPDILVIAKGIGSGVPVSAVGATSDVFSCLKKGEMSSTFGGNPVASAAVIAVLEIMEKEDLAGNSARMGLVMGLEFVKDKKTKEPDPELIKPLIVACANEGLLIGSLGMYGNVIRVAPPLVITKTEIDESVAILDKVWSKLRI